MTFEKFKILRGAVWFVCFIALTIETYNLYKDYNDYQTVVTVNITRQSVVNFPGIAICESHHFVKIKGDMLNHTSFPVPKGVWIKAKQKYPNFQKLFNKTIDDIVYIRLFMEDQILAKEAFGPFDDGFITCNNKATGESCVPVNHVNGFFSECTSFFNTIHYVNGSSRLLDPQKFHIVDNSRDNEMAEIKITKNESNDYHTNHVTVLVMPANTIPAFPDQKLAFRQDILKFGRRYDVTFSVTTILKLSQPYKPYCRFYESTDDTKSFYDCVTQCIHRKMFKMLNCSSGQMDVVLNEEFSEKRMCIANDWIEINYTEYLNIFKKCEYELCFPNCIQEIYRNEIKDVTDSPSFINEKPDSDTIIIKILPQDADEFTYIHHPKISRNDLFSKFGGLLSLWLGFSFFSIYTYIEHCIQKYLAKKVRLTKLVNLLFISLLIII